MPVNAAFLWYLATGVATFICVVDGTIYLRLSTYIGDLLHKSEEWRRLNMPPRYIADGRGRFNELQALIFSGTGKQMLPDDPAIALAVARARFAGIVFFIAFVAALVCLAAADMASNNRSIPF
jgi:hypothetical protein